MGDNIPCLYCGELFHKGWALKHHTADCKLITRRGLRGDCGVHDHNLGYASAGTDDGEQEDIVRESCTGDVSREETARGRNDGDSEDSYGSDVSADSSAGLDDAYRYQFLQAYYALPPRNKDKHGTSLGTGRLVVDAAQRLTVRFLVALNTGEGMSKEQQTLLLQFAKSLDGDGALLPNSLDGCWRLVSQLHAKLNGRRGQREVQIPIPADVRATLVHPDQTEVTFCCEDIVLILNRLLTNNPLNTDANLQLQYEESTSYTDFCHGGRFQRTQRAIGKDKAILCFTLFIDGLILDKGGFRSTKGCVLTCGNYRKHIRGSSDTKARVCSFPTLKFAQKHVPEVAKTWLKSMFHMCVKFLLEPVHHFNACGGAILPIRGQPIDFGRALIVALYTDCPEGDSLGLVGSACHRCYVPHDLMNDVAVVMPMRNEANMAEHKRRLQGNLTRGRMTKTKDEARKLGVNLFVENGFVYRPGDIGLFGPCPLRDHLWAALQQGMLHGFHEGILVKCLLLALALCLHYKGNRTDLEVLELIDTGFVKLDRMNSRCSNMEFTEHSVWMTFPHGVTDYLQKGKRLNGTYYSPMLRQMHVIVIANDLLPDHVCEPLCAVFDLVYKVEAQLNTSIPKDGGIEKFQASVTDMLTKLIAAFSPFSKSDCCSKKFHLPLHWGDYLRDIGCGADEKQQEKELGILFKKPVKFTNCATSTLDEQVGDRVWDKVMLRGVASDIGAADTLFMNWKGLSVEAELQRNGFLQPTLCPIKDIRSVAALGEAAAPNTRFVMSHPKKWTNFAFEDVIAGKFVLERARLKVGRGEMVEPLKLSPHCLMSILNPVGGPFNTGQHQRVTFRASACFRGMPWYDNVRVHDGPSKDARLALGRIVCFIADDTGRTFVALRWYQDWELQEPEDPRTHLCRVTYCKRSEIESYDIFPTRDIVSGALLIPSTAPNDADTFYIAQTPREQAEHKRRCNITYNGSSS
jgi:hypothetical protein